MKKFLSLLLAVLLSISMFGCSKPEVEGEVQEVIDRYYQLVDEWFVEDVSSDYLTMHFNLEDPSKYGIKDVEVTLGEIEDEDETNYYQQRVEKLKEINPKNLNQEARDDYEVVLDYYQLMAEVWDFEYDYGFLFSPNGGLNNNLISNFTEFDFRSEQDIKDFIVLLKDTKRFFDDAIKYTKEQAEDGIVQDSKVIEDVVKQIENFISKVDDNEIINVANNRIDKMNLANAQQYKEEIANAVKEFVIPAYKAVLDMYDGLSEEYKKTEGIAKRYQHGKEYYELLFKIKSSCNDSVADVEKKLLSKIKEVVSKIRAIYSKFTVEDEIIYDEMTYSYGYSDVYEMLDFIKEKMVNDYPQIADVEYTIDFLDPTVTSDSITAYYLLAPIDNVNSNVIKLNPNYCTDDPNGTCITMAHEGFPGHCNYHTYYYSTHKNSNIRYTLSYIGAAEGWAMISEETARQYFITKENNKFVNLDGLQNRFSYYLEAYCDILVNYEGYSVNDLMGAVSQWIGTDGVSDIYRALVGDPLLFIPYGVGLYKMETMRKDFETLMGDKYSLKDFNTIIMDTGEASYETYQARLARFAEENK